MLKKNIVLVYPVISEGIKFHWMPTSLLAISSKLHSYGYRVKIIDERISDKNKLDEILLREAKDALLVGFSVMTGYQIYGAARMSKLIKQAHPEVSIIWGGDHPTASPAQVLELDFVDMAVFGQGEETLFEIVNRLENKADLSNVSGLMLKAGSGIISGNTRKVHEIDPYYPLPYQLLDIKAYINPATMAFNYFTSFGCVPGKCSFCNTGQIYQGWKFVSSDKVVSQMKSLVDEHGFRNCKFQDSNFFVSEERAVEICNLMLNSSLKINWNASGRADQLSRYSDETFDLLVKSGCNCFFIGVESGSQRMLDKMGKMASVEDMITLSKKVKGLPIDLYLSLVFGLPEEKISDLLATAEHIKNLKKINTRIREQRCFFTPYPGTSAYNEAVKLGYSPPKDIYGWIKIEEPSEFVDVPWMDDAIKSEYKRIFEENFTYNFATKFN